MSEARSPEQILELMLANDQFSSWLQLEDIKTTLTESSCSYTIRPEMLNGFGTVHGGILFAASDSALGFVCNAADRLSVAIEVSISYTKAAKEGDRLIVTAIEVHSGYRTGVYDIKTHNQDGQLICIFKGTVYRTDKKL